MTTPISSNWATRSLRMFTGAEQFDNFSRLASIFPARVVRRSDHARPIPRAIQRALPRTYYFNNREHSSADFLADVDTVGLLVIKQGALVHEWYIDPLQATRQWPSWSVVKSIVSCLIGIAVAEHAIESIQDAVTRYVPALCGSAYDGVCIEQVLQMCSGAKWSENYADPDSDVQRSARVMMGIGSRDELAMSTKRARAPGTYHQYNSNDTQVLGMVLRSDG